MSKPLCDALTKDLGKSEFAGTLFEINGLLKDIDHTVDKVSTWAKDLVIDTPVSLAPGKTKIVYEPFGVALVLGAWNFPLALTLQPFIIAVAAGNCCLIKPSEGAPESMFAMKKLFDEYMDPDFF